MKLSKIKMLFKNEFVKFVGLTGLGLIAFCSFYSLTKDFRTESDEGTKEIVIDAPSSLRMIDIDGMAYIQYNTFIHQALNKDGLPLMYSSSTDYNFIIEDELKSDDSSGFASIKIVKETTTGVKYVISHSYYEYNVDVILDINGLPKTN